MMDGGKKQGMNNKKKELLVLLTDLEGSTTTHTHTHTFLPVGVQLRLAELDNCCLF